MSILVSDKDETLSVISQAKIMLNDPKIGSKKDSILP